MRVADLHCNLRAQLQQLLYREDEILPKLFDCGVESLKLLPGNSAPGLVIITDCSSSMKDIEQGDSVVAKLRATNVSVSFLKVGPEASPFSPFARLPDDHTARFFAQTSQGAFINQHGLSRGAAGQMNDFHRDLLAWSVNTLRSTDDDDDDDEVQEWLGNNVELDCKRCVRWGERLVTGCGGIYDLMACRMREGFTLGGCHLNRNSTGREFLEMKMSLLWKPNSYIHYVIQSKWPLEGVEECKIIILLQGDYNTIHDIFCLMYTAKKQHKSLEGKGPGIRLALASISVFFINNYPFLCFKDIFQDREGC